MVVEGVKQETKICLLRPLNEKYMQNARVSFEEEMERGSDCNWAMKTFLPRKVVRVMFSDHSLPCEYWNLTSRMSLSKRSLSPQDLCGPGILSQIVHSNCAKESGLSAECANSKVAWWSCKPSKRYKTRLTVKRRHVNSRPLPSLPVLCDTVVLHWWLHCSLHMATQLLSALFTTPLWPTRRGEGGGGRWGLWSYPGTFWCTRHPHYLGVSVLIFKTTCMSLDRAPSPGPHCWLPCGLGAGGRSQLVGSVFILVS